MLVYGIKKRKVVQGDALWRCLCVPHSSRRGLLFGTLFDLTTGARSANGNRTMDNAVSC